MDAKPTIDRTLALRLLTEAVKGHKKGKAGVAISLGYGRAMLSRVLSPNDPLQITDALAQRVIDRYHVVAECPATLQAQPRGECHRIALGAAPTHNPLSMRIWRQCQTCPHKPEVVK